MFRRAASTVRPLLRASRSSSRTSRIRTYASKPDNDKAINFRNFVSVGIISSIILTQVVEAVNKDAPRNKSMSESEYYRQQQRLKRKIALFKSDEKEVYFVLNADKVNIKEIEGFKIIDPEVLVEQERKDTESKYYALLNDENEKIVPLGLVVELIGRFLQQDEGNHKYLILNFPQSVKESTMFEDKIVTVKKVVCLKADNNNDASKSPNSGDLVKYYKTVDKVLEIDSVDELNKL